MLLGRGTASNDAAIMSEFETFYHTHASSVWPKRRQNQLASGRLLRTHIGKPILEWTEADIEQVYHSRSRNTHQAYNAFVGFLILRGYFHPCIEFFDAIPIQLCRLYPLALQEWRERFLEVGKALGYISHPSGHHLELLVKLLAVVAKPIEELQRQDFDNFVTQYRARQKREHPDGQAEPRLTRLDYYLQYLKFLDAPKVILVDEERLTQIRSARIQEAIVTYLAWAEVKYRPATVNLRRRAILTFFHWLQDQYPDVNRLENVTRSITLEYAKHLAQRREQDLSQQYCHALYLDLHHFFEFIMTEQLAPKLIRNPFRSDDMPKRIDSIIRYLTDHEIQIILGYCTNEGSLVERTVVTILLHTGIRASELSGLKVTDIVDIQGKWKLHIREGKGLKDRIIPLTEVALTTIRAWQESGWERRNDHLFTRFGRPWKRSRVSTTIRGLGEKLGLNGITPHRFRHTFAVALLNYGMRESAIQKLLGHETLEMTLHYARILDRTVEQAFDQAVGRMQDEPLSWVPNFFVADDYTLFSEGDAVGWIRLPLGYCRRNPKLHCESDVKCLLCNRFRASPADLPRFREMYERFVKLGLTIKAEVVLAQIRQLEAQQNGDFIPLEAAVPAIPTRVALAR